MGSRRVLIGIAAAWWLTVALAALEPLPSAGAAGDASDWLVACHRRGGELEGPFTSDYRYELISFPLEVAVPQWRIDRHLAHGDVRPGDEVVDVRPHEGAVYELDAYCRPVGSHEPNLPSGDEPWFVACHRTATGYRAISFLLEVAIPQWRIDEHLAHGDRYPGDVDPATGVRLDWKCELPSTTGYTVRSLGTFDGFESLALGINDLGQVVGSSDSGQGWLWDEEDGFLDLGSLGGHWTRGTAINASGQVVGESEIASDVYHAFIWDRAGGMHDLGTLGGAQSLAHDINDLGWVVGEADTATGERHAVLWTPDGGIEDLGTLGGTTSAAHGVNDLGQVVGSSLTVDGMSRPFLWEAGTGMRDLGTLGGEDPVTGGASDINNAGQVVGSSVTTAGVGHAFLWEPGTGMLDLGALGPGASRAAAIDERGQVTGATAVATPGVGSAGFVWERATGMVLLEPAGTATSAPADINEQGQIVGDRPVPVSGLSLATLWEPVAP